LLRESVQVGSRIHKRTLANRSHWPAARVAALRRALRGEFHHLGLGAEQPELGPAFALLFVLK